MAKAAHRFFVAFVDRRRIGKCLDRPFYAGFAQQMQNGIGRAVGEVFNGVGFTIAELIVGMKAGDLQYAGQPRALQDSIRTMQKVVIVKKIAKGLGQNQQCRVDLDRVGIGQVASFSFKFVQNIGVGL